MHNDKFMTLYALESLCHFSFKYIYVTHFLQLGMTYKGVLKPYQASIVGLFVQKIVQNTSEASL